jgi:hypothetical protein
VSIQLTEPIVAGLVAKLNQDLPAAIDALNASLTDETTVAYPQQILDHFPPLETLLVFPTVAVAEGAGTFSDDTGWSATGRYELAVHCYVSSTDQQVLVTQLRRLRTAVARVVMDGRTVPTADLSGTSAWGLVLKRLVPGATLGEFGPQGVETFMSWCGIVIEVTCDEDS